ncbi:MAG TPA: hypothetical protein VMK12_22345 [Anaeromyxobacteraceae bacterium]|nr:hypothetical protein [Anaeromyxobacteraceae bacterium]
MTRACRIKPRIRRRGENSLLGGVKKKNCVWVVEHTNAWHDRFRGLLVRWERIGAHCLGLLHLACERIAFCQATILRIGPASLRENADPNRFFFGACCSGASRCAAAIRRGPPLQHALR